MKTLTVAEVARKEKVSTKTIYEWIKTKRIDGFFKVGLKKDKYLFNSDYKKKPLNDK